MRSVINAFAVVLPVATILGLLALWIHWAQQSAQLAECRNNLRQIGSALHSYHGNYKRFPTGTLANSNLQPEKRFSWLAEIYPMHIEAGTVMLFDKTLAWDVPVNCPPRCRIVNCDDLTIAHDDHVTGELQVFLCPANHAQIEPNLPSLTHYVGIAGVGHAAASLPLVDAKAGFFGFDRQVTLKDLKRGTSTTMAVSETPDGGPWTAGGHATMRGLHTRSGSYVGKDGQFSSYHGAGTNALFADGAVRVLTTSVRKNVIEAMAVLAGHDGIVRFDD